MTGEEENKKGEGKGFAGLSSLVSDISATPSPVSKPTTITGAEPSTAHKAGQASPKPSTRPHQAPEEPSSGSSGGKWLFGFFIVVGMLWLIGQLNQQPTSLIATTDTPTNTVSDALSPPVQPQVPSLPEEVMPSIGSNLVLSVAQIRYCLAEDIRVTSAKSAVDNYSGSDVDRFNMMVADFNSRCGSFRYRSGALESARQDVEPYRSQLIAEGRSRMIGDGQTQVQSSSSKDDWSSQAPIFEEPTQVTDTLSTAEGMPESSGASSQLAFPELSSPPSRSTPDVPENAFVSGENWFCNSGFRKVGDRCEGLDVPENAFVSGEKWFCNSGFRKVGDRCEALDVPENAFVSGANWFCNSGFRKVGDRCEALDVPENAFVSGANWFCNSGFRKVGDKCVSIFKQ